MKGGDIASKSSWVLRLMIGGPGRITASSRRVTGDMLNTKNQRRYVIAH